MGFLYPGALVFFALVPALVLAYLARERPTRAVVSSVLAFRALRGLRRERFSGRPRFDWMFFAELFLLILAVLAMAGPFVLRPSNPIAVVLDNSAAMQVRDSAGKTRFEAAIEKLASRLSDEDSGGKITVYLTAPQPHRIAPPFDTLAEARFAIAHAAVSDAPNDNGALLNLLNDLGGNSRYRSVIYAGARALSAPVPVRIHAIAVGDPVPNFALGSFGLRREVFGEEALHARITFANFSTDSHNFEIKITGDGRQIGDAKAALAAGETGSLEFPALPVARVYRADLAPADNFPLDNVAFATAGSVKAVSILFVTPTPGDAAGLDQIPGVAVKTRSPNDFSPADLSNADLAIFEYAVPKEMPVANSLFVMPPGGDPVLRFATTAAAPVQIAGWDKTDILTDSVNFRLLNLHSGEYLGVHPWMSEVMSGGGGALMLRGERSGHRFVAAGFNPFPYLGKRNLSMSVLTLNVLGYLAGLNANSSGYRTGEPWLVPAGVRAVTLPSGKSVETTPGTLFTDVSAQGVYELTGPGDTKTPRAVNLADLTESDFENTPALRLDVVNAGPSSEAFNEKSPVSGYLLALIIALGALEAIAIYRRRRHPLQA
ncbi:MAG TPA: BatA and WFA domain-containing protein [Candidatus Binataceae bacterium]